MRKGVTLIEVLTVVAILTILVMLIGSMLSGANRPTYQSATCQGGCSCRMSR